MRLTRSESTASCRCRSTSLSRVTTYVQDSGAIRSRALSASGHCRPADATVPWILVTERQDLRRSRNLVAAGSHRDPRLLDEPPREVWAESLFLVFEVDEDVSDRELGDGRSPPLDVGLLIALV